MLVLKLIKETEFDYEYNYYPEDRADYGTLVINKKTGECTVKSVAKNEIYNIYLYHAISNLKKFFKNSNFLNETVVAWY